MSPSSPPPENCAIQYHPDGYKADREQVKGRHSAGAGFLKGFVSHSGVDRFICATDVPAHYEDFKELIGHLDPQARPAAHVPMKDPRGLREAGTLFLPGPSLENAWTRRLIGDCAYSLCGITHTVSSDRVISSLGDYLTLPAQPWDALICTSTSAKAAVERAIEIKAEYLAERGLTDPQGNPFKSPVQLPVIPLGVEAAAYRPGKDSERQRRSLRARLDLGDNDVACLFFGRLSFHSKAHPTPMFLAAERAQAHLKGKQLHLLFTGQFYNTGIEREFRQSAAAYCPSVPVHFLDGNNSETATASWRAADIFFSLSDNIQESFGLTPIEAMAAGLPCVVSDWNGYKDTITDGETGFRAPTLTPPGRAGLLLGDRYAAGLENYDRFIGGASLTTAVDIAACTTALTRLADDDNLRRTMGAAGVRRAADVYDWEQVVSAYQELWEELAQIRNHETGLAEKHNARSVNPSYPSPFAMFENHSTHILRESMTVSLSSSSRVGIEDIRQGTINTFANHLLLSDEDVNALLDILKEGPNTFSGLENTLHSYNKSSNRDALFRTIAWLAKYGLIDIT